jgi:hypothetical protein
MEASTKASPVTGWPRRGEAQGAARIREIRANEAKAGKKNEGGAR